MLYIHLFGRLLLLSDAEPWQFAVRPKTVSLSAYLLLHRAHSTPRNTLASLLWPDQPDSKARGDLRRHLHDLERALPPFLHGHPWILRHGDTLQWNPESSYWLDVADFERLSASPQYIAKAVTLHTGPLLPEVYESWLVEERERLDQLYVSGLRRLIAHNSAEGHAEQAIAYAQQALAHDPLLEDVARELMRLRYETGKRTEALQTYQTLKQHLRGDLGVGPTQETLALYEVILRDAVLPVIPLPDGSRETPKHNLPASLTTFVGRDEEIAALHRMVASVSSPIRLITLIGPPGAGKTRLALETSRSLLERQASSFPDGIFFVDLSALTESDLVLSKIAATLGVEQSAGQSIVERLKDHLRGRFTLLLIDNFEQVLEAGLAISELLAAAHQLRIIVTSRTPLNLYGEHEFPVSPLALPERGQQPHLDALRMYDAIALFEARARQRQPAFSVNEDNCADVAEICRQLDGLPLTIELAAGHVRTLSPAQMVQQMGSRQSLLTSELRDLPEKHKTLRAAIAWSYDLLNEGEQRLFRQVAVFAGGWSLEAARAVCDAGDDDRLLNGLTTLVDMSLVQRNDLEGGARYSMLATIRKFALDQLSRDAARPDVHLRHAVYFADLAEAVERNWYGDQIKTCLARLRTEEENLRAALGWALPGTYAGDVSPVNRAMAGVRLAMALNAYWKVQGQLKEGRGWLTRALNHRQRLPLEVQVKLIKRVASYMQRQADYEAAHAILEEALELARQSEDTLLIGKVLHDLGTLAGVTADYPRAETLLAESAALQREDSDGAMVDNLAYTMNNLALVYKHMKDYARAASILEEVLAFHRANNADIEIAATLMNLGNLALMQGELARAETCYLESLKLLYALDDQMELCDLLPGIAGLALAQGLPIRSAKLQGFSQMLIKKTDYTPPAPDRERTERDCAALTEQLGQQQLEALLAEGAAMTLDQAVAFALAANP